MVTLDAMLYVKMILESSVLAIKCFSQWNLGLFASCDHVKETVSGFENVLVSVARALSPSDAML